MRTAARRGSWGTMDSATPTPHNAPAHLEFNSARHRALLRFQDGRKVMRAQIRSDRLFRLLRPKGGALAFVLLVAALALPTTAAAKTSTAVGVTLAAHGCDGTTPDCGGGGGERCYCEYEYWYAAGKGVIQSLGSLPFTAYFGHGTFCTEIVWDPNNGTNVCLAWEYRRWLTLTFSDPAGNKLVLDETFASTTPFPSGYGQGAWTVDTALSTGRFAGYTGSGRYSIESADSYHFSIRLDGTLIRS
jgi:hypothetical protein